MAYAFSSLGRGADGEMTPMDRRAQTASSQAYWREAIGLSHLEFSLMGIPYDPTGGFSASLSLLPAPLSASAIISFAGTDPSSWANWKANIGQGLFGRSSQYDQAVRLAVDSSQALGGNVVFAGHSLGGGLASAAAYATGASAVTFNAAGLHSNYRTGAHGGIRAHYVRGDILTTFQQWTPFPNAAGTPVSHSGQGGPIRRHGLASFP